MSYFFLIVTILTGIYAYTYARWLKQNGNPCGAWGIFFLIALGIMVAVYRLYA